MCGVLTALQKCAALWGELAVALLYTALAAAFTTVRVGRGPGPGGVFTFRCRRANEASGREGLNYMHTKMKDILA